MSADEKHVLFAMEYLHATYAAQGLPQLHDNLFRLRPLSRHLWSSAFLTIGADHFKGGGSTYYGAPSVEAATPVAQEEITQMVELCEDHAPNTLLTVTRELTEAGVREAYRVIEAQDAGIDQFAVHGSLDDE